MPIKSILVGVDFSDITDSVVKTANFFAKLFEARVKLIHVIEPPSPILYEDGFEPLLTVDGMEVVVEVENLLKEKAEEEMKKLLQLFDNNIPVDYQIEIGDIAETILEVSDEEKFDLVLIGSHQKGLLEILLLGGTAEKIVNKSKTSVLVVKGNPIEDIKKLLVGYDFLPNSIEALEVAKDIAKRTKAEIDIVHIDADEWFAHLAHVHEEVFNKKIKILEEIKEKIEKELSIPVKFEIEKGDPEELLLEKIKEYNPDLAVVGKRKGKKIKRFFLGTTAMKVVRNSPKPVLIVRKREE